MKTFTLTLLILLAVAVDLSAQEKIEWLSFETATLKNEEASKKNKKKIFIDIYTDWCGWCVRMDQSTFKDSAVVAVMNKYFIASKLNAERKDTVKYKDDVFVNPSPGTPRSTHQLAISLLKGQLSYPSFVIMNENNEVVQIIKGYREAKEFVKILRFFGEDIYLTKSWAEYNQ